MSEVLLLLKLRRRSGVLAAAVAAVHKAGLTFKSQQPRELDGSPALLLTTESEVVPDHATLSEVMASVSGVDSLIEILVDGAPLSAVESDADSVFDEGRLPASPELDDTDTDSPWSLETDSLAVEPAASVEPELTSDDERGAGAETEARDFPRPLELDDLAVELDEEDDEAGPEGPSDVLADVAQRAVSTPSELKPEPEPEPEPELEVSSSKSDHDGETELETEQAGRDEDPGSGREMTRAMKRRWRRYR